MRLLLFLLCLTATAASAQAPRRFSAQAEPSASPSPDEPEWARTPPPAIGPAESTGTRAQRYSRFSAGPGGPSVVVAEVLLGLSGGALLGNAYDAEGSTSNAYFGAMMGGLALGTAGTFYQYFVPVGRRESVLATLASVTWMMGGIGFANGSDVSDHGRGIIALVSSQAGLFGALLLTAGGEDVSGSDMGLMGMSSLYAFLVTSLVEFINDAESSGGYNFTPMLIAPAVGLALGGLLSIPLELSPLRLAAITFLPLIPTGMSIALAAPLSGNATTGRVVLTTLSASFILTTLVAVFTYEPPPQERASASTVRLSPVPVVMAAGRRNSSLAAGPGLRIQF
ncbi:hypothetical protein [Hyalangium rubrum]|uniref:Integral membrane protein n=1 Tax=Hyalangium rubrum TaxID=3103134 RepID=A0ABU5GZA1_9BACT|nr:hypothetical protein [Hyalangium sp. s54d21]MDY7226209.1 hypothetical protein [Hyalangium sp. s54d21]